MYINIYVYVYVYVQISLFKERYFELEHLERSEKTIAPDRIR